MYWRNGHWLRRSATQQRDDQVQHIPAERHNLWSQQSYCSQVCFRLVAVIYNKTNIQHINSCGDETFPHRVGHFFFGLPQHALQSG